MTATGRVAAVRGHPGPPQRGRIPPPRRRSPWTTLRAPYCSTEQAAQVLGGHSADLLLVAAHTGGLRGRAYPPLPGGGRCPRPGPHPAHRLDETRPLARVELRDTPARRSAASGAASAPDPSAALAAREPGRRSARRGSRRRRRPGPHLDGGLRTESGSSSGRPIGSFQGGHNTGSPDLYVQLQAARRPPTTPRGAAGADSAELHVAAPSRSPRRWRRLLRSQVRRSSSRWHRLHLGAPRPSVLQARRRRRFCCSAPSTPCRRTPRAGRTLRTRGGPQESGMITKLVSRSVVHPCLRKDRAARRSPRWTPESTADPGARCCSATPCCRCRTHHEPAPAAACRAGCHWLHAGGSRHYVLVGSNFGRTRPPRLVGESAQAPGSGDQPQGAGRAGDRPAAERRHRRRPRTRSSPSGRLMPRTPPARPRENGLPA